MEKTLLEETDEKIIDISQMVGYVNDKHFMKIFKSICGVFQANIEEIACIRKKRRIKTKNFALRKDKYRQE